MKKMLLLVKMLFVITFYQVQGDNVMLGKPSKQSSTDVEAGRANDGLDSTLSATSNTEQPYWQGDLQGYYQISNITVRISDYSGHEESLFIGGSVMDVNCPGSDVITCGQWRDENEVFLQTFSCNFSQPIRFIRIWREIQDHLLLHEVAVQGVPGKISGLTFKSSMSKRLHIPSASLKVATETECAKVCLARQPCLAFSFRQGGQPSCYLATNVSISSDTDWKTHTVNDCHKFDICN